MQKTSCHHDQDHSHNSHAHSESQRDPVCGMEVKSDSPYRESVEGKTYRFCSAKCLQKFQIDPHSYMGHSSHEAHQHTSHPTISAPEGAAYTCPMHPEIRQPTPGNCPICGMTLEPVIPEPGRGGKPGAEGLLSAILVDPTADRHRDRAGDGWPFLATVSWHDPELGRAWLWRRP